MPFSQERVDAAYKFWRLLPYHERTEKELRICLKRHGLVDIDAAAYARDLIAKAIDLEPMNSPTYPVLLSTWYRIIPAPESEGPAAVSPAADTGEIGK